MAAPQRVDPYLAQNFVVEIDGIARASFAEVSGIGAEIGVIEYRNGSEDITVRKLPGLVKYSNITLKRGVTRDLALWQWFKAARDGRVRRANGTIALLDESRQEVLRFVFRRGWPCKWEGPALNAAANEVAIELLEICHEGVEIDE
jgi:phage tail-like protein